ncbi:PREDICTED: putative uncharacterized protein FLJ37770 isoform X2 [Dinoponera quadriceps]|uniref:Mos1 transposase HTH domain-containing protein n=1 Tax=Dinoponera quadriceps TaxID=609295 RepID=A0A6P3XZD1_DINQU|nr:PREDICTED: putative uncharacterized protein FLJ37770 isoform X2 [Dinoponera quadriceps]
MPPARRAARRDLLRRRAKMQHNLEQRYAIKFCVKLGKSRSETLEMLRTAYGDAALPSAQAFRWHKAFKDGRDNIEDEQRAGCPLTSRTGDNVASVEAILDKTFLDLSNSLDQKMAIIAKKIK